MRVLKKNDLQLFEQIASLSQESLIKAMTAMLHKHYGRVVTTRDYIYAEGDYPVALVAHMDTVFPKPPTNVYYDEKKGVLWSPEGLGADDRAGVFAIIKIIESGLYPHIILTTDEEKGGIGASMLTQIEKNAPFQDLRYIIQLDRCGTNDCVFYDCDNPDFTKYVEGYGFVEAIGSFSDISELCPSWEVAGVNLSVGYENEHSIAETLHVAPLLSTISKVSRMVKDSVNAEHFKWIPGDWYYTWYGKSLLNSTLAPEEDADDSLFNFNSLRLDDDPDNFRVACKGCGKTFWDFETFPTKTKKDGTVFYCGDCIVDRVEWCEECSEPFEIDKAHPTNRLCHDCYKRIAYNKKHKEGK